MYKVSNVNLPIDFNDNVVKSAIGSFLGKKIQINSFRFLKLSLDCRKKNDIKYVATIVFDTNQKINSKKAEIYTKPSDYAVKTVKAIRPIVVGAGPSGLFCGLVLAMAGLKPIILERGAKVEDRIQSIENFRRTRVLDTSSNVQFGEGGAGTFSDGKLTTGTKDERNRFVKETFVKFGAKEDILYSNKPHIGTDYLVKIIPNIRNEIIRLGGSVLFNHRVCDFLIEKDKIAGVVAEYGNQKVTFKTDDVVLATGHSARDIFATLKQLNINMEQKAFSIGVRVEHLQEDIDRSQYGDLVINDYISGDGDMQIFGMQCGDNCDLKNHKDGKLYDNNDSVQCGDNCDLKNHKDGKLYDNNASVQCGECEHFRQSGIECEINEKYNHNKYRDAGLPPADYKLACHLPNGRSVYTFCMCPGGEVVASSSEEGMVVTNGMSNNARDMANANSAVLVNVVPSDFGSSDVLAGVEFQRKYERLAYEIAGSNYNAPCQKMMDFCRGEVSTEFGKVKPSYLPAVTFCDMSKCLPSFVTNSLKQGFIEFNKKIKGFLCEDALLIGVETRTSSPIRILRDDGYESNVKGLYPTGEGAGYAGGIMSAAVDGIKVAEKIISKYDNNKV